MARSIGDDEVHGVEVGPETRCAHYGSERDVIALQLGCCGEFFACHRCHEAVTDHESQPWPRERFGEPAVLCGVCGTALSVTAYLDAAHTCPDCDAEFNPGCRKHYDRYFEGHTE